MQQKSNKETDNGLDKFIFYRRGNLIIKSKVQLGDY